jgi:hypothetical protein
MKDDPNATEAERYNAAEWLRLAREEDGARLTASAG